MTDSAHDHASDCAVHNAPALPAGQCDCGADTVEYTPGPWEYIPGQPSCGPYVTSAFSIIIGPKTGQRAPEDEANARLASAAPELLEALRVAHSELGNLPEEMFDETKQRACAIAYAAIAKAGA